MNNSLHVSNQFKTLTIFLFLLYSAITMTPFSPSENPLTESSRIPVLSPSPSSSSVQRGQREVEDQGVEEREERLESEWSVFQFSEYILTYHTALCIPQAAFVRLVEEITSEVEIEGKPVQGIDWQPLALLALQEAAEAFLIDLLKSD